MLGHLDDFDTERNGVSEILCRCPDAFDGREDEIACDADLYVTSVDKFCPELPASLKDAIVACVL